MTVVTGLLTLLLWSQPIFLVTTISTFLSGTVKWTSDAIAKTMWNAGMHALQILIVVIGNTLYGKVNTRRGKPNWRTKISYKVWSLANLFPSKS